MEAIKVGDRFECTTKRIGFTVGKQYVVTELSYGTAFGLDDDGDRRSLGDNNSPEAYWDMRRLPRQDAPVVRVPKVGETWGWTERSPWNERERRVPLTITGRRGGPRPGWNCGNWNGRLDVWFSDDELAAGIVRHVADAPPEVKPVEAPKPVMCEGVDGRTPPHVPVAPLAKRRLGKLHECREALLCDPCALEYERAATAAMERKERHPHFGRKSKPEGLGPLQTWSTHPLARPWLSRGGRR